MVDHLLDNGLKECVTAISVSHYWLRNYRATGVRLKPFDSTFTEWDQLWRQLLTRSTANIVGKEFKARPGYWVRRGKSVREIGTNFEDCVEIDKD